MVTDSRGPAACCIFASLWSLFTPSSARYCTFQQRRTCYSCSQFTDQPLSHMLIKALGALIGFNCPGWVAPHPFPWLRAPISLQHGAISPCPSYAVGLLVSSSITAMPGHALCQTGPWPVDWLPSLTSDQPPPCRTWLVVTELSRTLAAATRLDPTLPT